MEKASKVRGWGRRTNTMGGGIVPSWTVIEKLKKGVRAMMLLLLEVIFLFMVIWSRITSSLEGKV